MKFFKKTVAISLAMSLLIGSQVAAMPSPAVKREAPVMNPAYLDYAENPQDYIVIPPTSLNPRKDDSSISLFEADEFDPPVRFSLADEGYMSSVKNQGLEGVCWSFAALGSLESNIMKKYDKIEFDLSENHMRYALAALLWDQPVNEHGVLPRPELADIEQADSKYRNSNGVRRYANGSGNFDIAMAYLTRGMTHLGGPAMETDDPYIIGEESITEPGEFREYSDIQDLSYEKRIWAKDIIEIPYDQYMAGSSESYRNDIKYHLMNYGAVATNYYTDDSKGLNQIVGNPGYGVAYYYQYNPTDTKNVNHGVLIVGWDDDYDKDNFRYKHDDETFYRPTINGAWIVKNSWGEGYGENGLFYVSYQDGYFGLAPVVFTAPDLSRRYTMVYEYDQFGRTGTYPLFLDDPESEDPPEWEVFKVEWAVNEFTAERDEIIVSIGINAMNPNTTFEVYFESEAPDNPDDPENPDDPAGFAATGYLDYEEDLLERTVMVAQRTVDLPGYYTIDFDKAMPIFSGEVFRVFVKAISGETENFGYEAPTDVVNEARSEAGQSFAGILARHVEWDEEYPTGIVWMDMGAPQTVVDSEGDVIGVHQGANLCLKALASDYAISFIDQETCVINVTEGALETTPSPVAVFIPKDRDDDYFVNRTMNQEFNVQLDKFEKVLLFENSQSIRPLPNRIVEISIPPQTEPTDQ